MEFSRPIVVASRCLGFAFCRWNGQTIRCPFVNKLKPYVEFLTPCPEAQIGLGIPRKPIRIVRGDDEERLMQPATERDWTQEMVQFADQWLSDLGPVDGFILKSRSPTCGIKDVKVYPGTEKAAAVGKTAGFFARQALERFPGLPIEDEGRLTNYNIREQFLTALFALARLREVRRSGEMRELVAFHTSYKFILLAYNEPELRVLGRLVANPDKRPFEDLSADYETHFRNALATSAKRTSNINVLMHGLGFFSDELSSEEKAYFLDLLEKYREARVPLSSVLTVLRSWVIRFGDDFLKQQYFFEPYPEDLVETRDSGKGTV